MGSVKDIVIIQEPTDSWIGLGKFIFSDRYSVFDWGEMPDRIKNKGASLCMMSAYFFEQLAEQGIRTHYVGIMDGKYFMTTDKLAVPCNEMAIYLVNVVKPTYRDGKYDYSVFHQMKGNFLIPLEVMYRNTLSIGSSVFRRYGEGSLSLQGLGLTKKPEEGDLLPAVFIDVSTKHEEFDRYPDERKCENRATFFGDLSGLSNAEIEQMEYMVRAANDIITEGASHAGLRNDDGKFEFAFMPDRRLMLVDAIGTLDECRFTYSLDGEWIEVSKEILRQWYCKKQPEWVAEIDAAKKSGKADWKSLVKIQPKPMPPVLVEMVGNVYSSVANAVLGRQLFSAPSLDEVIREYQRFRELEMK